MSVEDDDPPVIIRPLPLHPIDQRKREQSLINELRMNLAMVYSSMILVQLVLRWYGGKISLVPNWVLGQYENSPIE